MSFEPTERQRLESAREAAHLLKAMSNESRMLILCQLIEKGEMSVSQLESDLGYRQSKLSQHLTLLRTERLVSARRDGKNVYYSVMSEEVEKTVELMHALFCSEDAVRRRETERSSLKGAA